MQSRISRLDIPARPAPLDSFSFVNRDNTWLPSVDTRGNLSLRPEIYSWKLEPLLKGISLASLWPKCREVIIESVWQSGWIELVIETPFRLNASTVDLPVLPVTVWSVISITWPGGRALDSQFGGPEFKSRPSWPPGGFVHGSHQYKSSAMLVNNQLICLPASWDS